MKVLKLALVLAFFGAMLMLVSGCRESSLSSELIVDAKNSAPGNQQLFGDHNGQHKSGVAPIIPAPASVTVMVNKVLVDDRFCKITAVNKTVDEYGDAGYTLLVENRLQPIRINGKYNFIYLKPVLWTWTVYGVAIDPQISGNINPGKPARLFLYFDDLDNVDQLGNVKGTMQVFGSKDWWDPIEVYEFELY